MREFTSDKHNKIWKYLCEMDKIGHKEYRNKLIFKGHQVFQIIAKSFDLSKPIYTQDLEIGDLIIQFPRNPGNECLNIKPIGEWFTIKSASKGQVAIFDGLTGRSRMEFIVKYQIKVLEGTAAKADPGDKIGKDKNGKDLINWDIARGGNGGGAQMFIPNKLLYFLEPTN